MRRGALATLAAVLVGAGVVASPWGYFPGPDFYASAAQIMPVLLVALAVESSAHELWASVPTWLRLYTFSVLAAGEVSAILASAGILASAPEDATQPEPFVGPGLVGTNILLALTVAGLIVGFVSVMYLAFFRVRPAETVDGKSEAPQARPDGTTDASRRASASRSTRRRPKK